METDSYTQLAGLDESCSLKERDQAIEPRPEVQGLFNPLRPAYVLKHEKYEHREIAYLKAAGHTDREIAEITGCTTAMIGYVKKQPWFEKFCLSLVHKNGDATLEFIAQKSEEAARRLAEIALRTENEETARKACVNLLEMKYGKPNQPMSVNDKSTADLSTDDLMKIAAGKN